MNKSQTNRNAAIAATRAMMEFHQGNGNHAAADQFEAKLNKLTN